MRLESGDQTGAPSRQLPRVSSRTRPLSTSATQRFVRDWSFIWSIHSRENTICFPSGEMFVADTDSMSMKVSRSRTLIFSAADSVIPTATTTTDTHAFLMSPSHPFLEPATTLLATGVSSQEIRRSRETGVQEKQEIFWFPFLNTSPPASCAPDLLISCEHPAASLIEPVETRGPESRN